MPLYNPYVTPIFYASFIYQDSSVKAVYFYYAALTAQRPLCSLSWTFPPTNNAFVLSSFCSHTPLVIISIVFLEG